MEVKDLKEAAIKFIDNGGGIGNPVNGEEAGKPCDYCNGAKDPESSDHPNKAIISVESDRLTEYGVYVSVQNELLAAYSDLRNKYSQKKYGMSFSELEAKYIDSGRKDEELKKKVKDVKVSYPQVITDIDPEN